MKRFDSAQAVDLTTTNVLQPILVARPSIFSRGYSSIFAPHSRARRTTSTAYSIRLLETVFLLDVLDDRFCLGLRLGTVSNEGFESEILGNSLLSKSVLNGRPFRFIHQY